MRLSRASYGSLTVASMVATREGRRSEMKVAGGWLSGMGQRRLFARIAVSLEM